MWIHKRFSTITAREIGFKSEPVDSLGEGWVLRHIPSRFSSPNDQTPCLVKTIFYSPILKVKFDTEGLAKKFVKCVQDCYGDEAAATHMLDKKLCSEPDCNSYGISPHGKCRSHGPRCMKEGCMLAQYARGFCNNHDPKKKEQNSLAIANTSTQIPDEQAKSTNNTLPQTVRSAIISPNNKVPTIKREDNSSSHVNQKRQIENAERTDNMGKESKKKRKKKVNLTAARALAALNDSEDEESQNSSDVLTIQSSGDTEDTKKQDAKGKPDVSSTSREDGGAPANGDGVVVLSSQMKKRIVSYLSDKDGVRVKKIAKSVEGLSEICQDMDADNILQANLSKELDTKIGKKGTKYFLSNTLRANKDIGISSKKRKERKNDDSGKKSSKKSSNDQASAVVLSDKMKARIIQLVFDGGGEGVRAKTMKEEVKGFRDICQDVNAHDVLQENLSDELELKTDEKKRTRYYLKGVLKKVLKTQAKENAKHGLAPIENEVKESNISYKKETLIELTDRAKDMTFPPGCRVVSSSGGKGVVVGAYLSLSNGEGVVIYEIETVTETNGHDVDTIMIKEQRLSVSPATPVHFKTNPEEVKAKTGRILSSSRDSNGLVQYSVWINEKMETIERVLPEQLSLPYYGRKYPAKKTKKDTKLSRAVSSASGDDDTPDDADNERVEKKKCEKGSGNEVKNGKKHKQSKKRGNSDEKAVGGNSKSLTSVQNNEEAKQTSGFYHCAICNVNCTSESGYQLHLNGKGHKKKMRMHDASVVQGVANELIADEIAEEQNKKFSGEQVEKKSNKKQKKRSGKKAEKKSNKKRKLCTNEEKRRRNEHEEDIVQGVDPPTLGDMYYQGYLSGINDERVEMRNKKRKHGNMKPSRNDANMVQVVANQIIANEIAEEKNKKFPGEQVEKNSNKKRKRSDSGQHKRWSE